MNDKYEPAFDMRQTRKNGNKELDQNEAPTTLMRSAADNDRANGRVTRPKPQHNLEKQKNTGSALLSIGHQESPKGKCDKSNNALGNSHVQS